MATVNFLYRSIKDKSFLNIRLLFRHNNSDYVIGGVSKIETTKNYWTKYHNSKRIKDPDILNEQKRVGDEIDSLSGFILDKFNKIHDDDIPKVVNKEWLKNIIKHFYTGNNNSEINSNLLFMIDYYIKNRKLSSSSIKSYISVKKIIEMYQKYYNEIVHVSDINESFKIKLNDLMIKERYSVNTISTYLTCIKVVCNYAGYLGININRQLSKLSVSKERVNNVYLSFDELAKIEQLNIDSPILDNVRDLLIISCYTGQRLSDFIRFKKEMIRYEDNKPYIEFTQQKTGKIMTIPLHKKVIEILDKRNGEFPKVNNNSSYYNLYLKKIGKLAGLNDIVCGSILEIIDKETNTKRKKYGHFKKYELLSSHIGRRSFATNFYGTIPTTFLIYITGHSTEQMFLNYIGKSNKDLAKEVFKYFE